MKTLTNAVLKQIVGGDCLCDCLAGTIALYGVKVGIAKDASDCDKKCTEHLGYHTLSSCDPIDAKNNNPNENH